MRHGPATAMLFASASVAWACSDGRPSGYRAGDTGALIGGEATGDSRGDDSRGDDSPPGDWPGDSLVGDSHGDPTAGDATGDAGGGDPWSGDPIHGDPLAGDSGAGDPMPGDAIDGDPGPTDCGEVGLCVRLTWNNSSGDLDLHLSKDDAHYCSNQSCYFGNCKAGSVYRVEWDGLPGLSDGDPTLSEDSWGAGPETIEIAVPNDGAYVIGVYYQPSGSEPVEATVEVVAGGVTVAAATGTLQPDGFWEAIAVGFVDSTLQNSVELDRTCPPGGWSCNDPVGICP